MVTAAVVVIRVLPLKLHPGLGWAEEGNSGRGAVSCGFVPKCPMGRPDVVNAIDARALVPEGGQVEGGTTPA